MFIIRINGFRIYEVRGERAGIISMNFPYVGVGYSSAPQLNRIGIIKGLDRPSDNDYPRLRYVTRTVSPFFLTTHMPILIKHKGISLDIRKRFK